MPSTYSLGPPAPGYSKKLLQEDFRKSSQGGPRLFFLGISAFSGLLSSFLRLLRLCFGLRAGITAFPQTEWRLDKVYFLLLELASLKVGACNLEI